MSFSNAMTIDVEDYFQVAALSQSISYDDWDSIPVRVEKNTMRLLDLFDQYKIKATFFVLGWVAERHPQIVTEIYKRGHEVASHGYSHQLIYMQSENVFKEESRRSKEILEDIIQAEVIGYRAASYSITNDSIWALEILSDLGYKYDSSIFPVKHDRYGIVGAPRFPYVHKIGADKSIVEFPLTTNKILGKTMPIAGGGYFRIFPYWYFKSQFSKSVKDSPGVFYLHPWEIDPEQPKVKASKLSTFRHYYHLNKTEVRLKDMLNSFEFTTMKDVLLKQGLFQ